MAITVYGEAKVKEQTPIVTLDTNKASAASFGAGEGEDTANLGKTVMNAGLLYNEVDKEMSKDAAREALLQADTKALDYIKQVNESPNKVGVYEEGKKTFEKINEEATAKLSGRAKDYYTPNFTANRLQDLKYLSKVDTEAVLQKRTDNLAAENELATQASLLKINDPEARAANLAKIYQNTLALSQSQGDSVEVQKIKTQQASDAYFNALANNLVQTSGAKAAHDLLTQEYGKGNITPGSYEKMSAKLEKGVKLETYTTEIENQMAKNATLVDIIEWGKTNLKTQEDRKEFNNMAKEQFALKDAYFTRDSENIRQTESDNLIRSGGKLNYTPPLKPMTDTDQNFLRALNSSLLAEKKAQLEGAKVKDTDVELWNKYNEGVKAGYVTLEDLKKDFNTGRMARNDYESWAKELVSGVDADKSASTDLLSKYRKINVSSPANKMSDDEKEKDARFSSAFRTWLRSNPKSTPEQKEMQLKSLLEPVYNPFFGKTIKRYETMGTLGEEKAKKAVSNLEEETTAPEGVIAMKYQGKPVWAMEVGNTLLLWPESGKGTPTKLIRNKRTK